MLYTRYRGDDGNKNGPDLIDEVDEESGAGVEAEYLDVGVGGQHRRVEADDVRRGGDQDAHLPSRM